MNLYGSEKLSNSIDDYIEDGITCGLDDELKELFELSMDITDMDIEISEEKKENAYKNMMNRSIKESKNMNNKKILTKVASIALIGIIGIGSIQTGFAQNMYEKIINLKYVTVEESNLTDEEYENKHLSESNNMLEQDIYGDKFIYIYDLEKAKEYIKFDLKMPENLPEGYKFKNICFYVDKLEDINGEHTSIIYEKNGKDFFINEVLATEDNRFKTRGKGIEEIKINGRKAVIDKRGNIDIEIDDVILTLLTKGNLSRDEAIEIIKSIK